jgi:hypothetical protein
VYHKDIRVERKVDSKNDKHASPPNTTKEL